MSNRFKTQEITESIHQKFYPEEVRVGEPIKAFIKINSVMTEFRVWRISPLGIELVNNTQTLSFGSSFDLQVNIGLEKSYYYGLVVSTTYTENKLNIIGIIFYHDDDNLSWKGDERRKNRRWVTSTEFMPNGVCPNPAKFNDFIFFKIQDISASGMQLITSMRNKYLLTGMKLDCNVSFPTLGNTNILLLIKNVRIIENYGRDYISLGCEFVNNSKNTMSMLTQYIFQFGPRESLAELKKEGLIIDEVSKGIQFNYVRTKEEYEQVVELRRKSYSGAGKSNPKNMYSDVYDSRSRIIIGTHHGKIVASTRLIFNDPEDTMEHEQFVELNGKIPRKDEICEITRVCTDPDYRGSDLLSGLLKHVALTVAQSGKRYILGSSETKLLPLYNKIGFANTDIKYKHADINNIEHTIFMCDIYDVAVGKGINPIVWNILWRDVVFHLHDNSIINFDNASKIRIGFFSMFRNISLYLYRKKMSRKSAK